MVITEEQVIPGHSVIRALHTGPSGSLLLAARHSDGKELAVKTFRPISLMDGDSERVNHHQRVTAFLAVAKLQQELARHAKRWGPIHDLGSLPATSELPEGAFCSMDHYPASLLWLIRGGVTVRAGPLQSIVCGILDGLAELRAAAHRGHGRLTPANVLLSSRDLRTASVVLSDPATDITTDAGDTADDRWALGLLIYRLITHQEVRRKLLLPISTDASWTQLGRHADAWLSICNRLLARDAKDRPELDEIAAEVRTLSQTDRGRAARRFAMISGSCVLAFAAAVLGVSEYQYRKACATEASHPAWLQKLVEKRNDPDFRAAIMSDPELMQQQLPELLDQVAAVVNSSDRPLIPTPTAFAAARNGAANVIQLTSVLLHWGRLKQIQDDQRQADALGWRQVAVDLKAITDGLPPDGSDQVDRKLIFMIHNGAATDETFTATKNEWDNTKAKIDHLSDPAAHALAVALLNRRIGFDKLDALRSDLLGVQSDCTTLNAFVTRMDSPQDYNDLREAVRNEFITGIPPELQKPLNDLAEYVQLDPATPAAFDIDKACVGESNMLAKLNQDGNPDAAALAKAYDGIVADFNALKARQWRHLDASVLNSAYTKIQSRQYVLDAKLNSGIHLDDQKVIVRNWVHSLDDAPVVSKEYPSWANAITALRTDAAITKMAGDDGLFQSRKAWATAWIQLLTQLDQRSQSACILPDDFKNIPDIMDGWVKAVQQALPAVLVDVPAPLFDELVMKAERSPWCVRLKQIDTDFPAGPPLASTAIAKWDGPYQHWVGANAKPQDKQFWNDEVTATPGGLNSVPRLQRAAKQLTAMDATANKSPENLVKLTANPTVDLTSLIAGIRLLAASADPKTWPLPQSAGWFKSVSSAAASLQLNSDDLVTLSALKRARWMQAVNTATSADDLAIAANCAAGFDVDLLKVGDLAGFLQPRPYYNLLVCLIRYPAADRAAVSSDQLKKAIAALPPVDRDMTLKALASAAPTDPLNQTMNDNAWYDFGAKYLPPLRPPPPPPNTNTAVANNQNQEKPKPKLSKQDLMDKLNGPSQ